MKYLKNLLRKLKFQETSGKVWVKRYKPSSLEICINFESETIEYPNQIELGDRTTSNFAREENFVVLECVDRLLRMGYPADRIELEKRWPLGRRNSGRLDILVRSKDGNGSYLMIECKTYRDEFDKETSRMLENGGQLFSYWQQDRSAEYLCLYSSKYNHDEDELDFRSNIVSVDDQLRNSESVEEAFTRWNKQFNSKGLFEQDVHPYNAEFSPLIRRDLRQLGKPDGNRIYYQFLEILRHNIVSDKGNAFNKIFNLFLCKILDEDRNGDEILDFQWKEGIDDEESLLGRLNSLYKKGMLRYLNKDVTDYSADELPVFEDEQVRTIINELRLYKNQEFAFVDVYNRDSFLENARIVIEIVKLLQRWQIRYSHKQQFLGEFFELLLNTGFKQESGQFFTPVPLVRFILHSLPIEQIVESKIRDKENHFLPFLIDYACGSGHFLTEAMDIIFGIIKTIDKTSVTPNQNSRLAGYLADEFGWAKEYIYGVERDYRLAKTSKLASFLNGDGEAVIAHASGLEDFSSDSYFGRLQSNSNTNERFDILVANPPYAVKGFKRTVDDGASSFSLYSKLSDKSNEIEVLFIERMVQLVKPNGVAGVILPRSILNNSGIYSDARKLIFENFQLRAIVVLGSKAFMATGINTVVLFLRKRPSPITLESQSDYYETFEKDDEQGGVILVNSLEKEEEKRFLGYEFSSRKGSEGMKIRPDSLLLNEEDQLSPNYVNSYIRRAMLNEPIDSVNEKLSPHVNIIPLKELFDWDVEPFTNALTFINKFELDHPDPGVLVSLLDCISVLESGSRPTGGANELSLGVPSLGGTQIHDNNGEVIFKKLKVVPESFYDNMTKGHVKIGDILICKDGARTGKCAYFADGGGKYSVNEHLFVVRADQSKCSQKYMFYFMMSSFFQNQVKVFAYNKKGQPGLNQGHFKRIQFPRLPAQTQERIVSEIEKKWSTLNQENERAEFIDRIFENNNLRSTQR